ncbi:MAG: UDP-N-acetylmuramoyl-tripeptide--D-alanyl-D-alanine ligase [Clostridia bacterium]
MQKEIDAKKIQEICNGKLLTNNIENKVNNFVIDSRNVSEGDCFVAIKGENNNGNKFLKMALEKGASVCLVDEEADKEIIEKYNNRTIIEVADTIKAIQEIAKYKRRLYDIPVVAVTGSVGKTSTKDIIASILGEKYNVLKTEGNFNNHIGLPMTLLKLKDHTAVVVEMGMNHFNEISVLTNIAKPTVAVITNIGTSHIGNLGSRENILKAKLEILEGLQENGKIIINNDNDLLHNWAQTVDNHNVLTYGIENKSQFVPKNIEENNNETKYEINIEGTEYNVKVPVMGKHFIYNSLCAIAVGRTLNIEPEKIIQGISDFKLTAKRMDFRKVKNNAIVLADYYNASYDSMKSALEVVKDYKATRRIAVLGDMLELGEFSEQLHKDVGTEVYNNKIDILITVGTLAKYIAQTAKKLGTKEVYECESKTEAAQILKNTIKEGDLILLKASNAMHFGEIMESLQ